MAKRGRAFLFCRYSLAVNDEVLDPNGQLSLLQERQGQYVAHGPTAEREGHLDTLIMRPKRGKLNGYQILTWSVGQRIDYRVKAIYDAEADDIELKASKDGGVRFTDFVSVPSLGVLAVDDRGGELHLGGKAAINRFRSVIRQSDGADADVMFQATPDEVNRALSRWNLTKFKFTIQPNNPRPVSRLSRQLSDQFRIDGIGKFTGTAEPEPDRTMKKGDGGFIDATSGLVNAGYGQMAVEGKTEDGLEAEIKKPRFDRDIEKNEKIQQKPRELRVYVEDEEQTDSEILSTAAEALLKFYGDAD